MTETIYVLANELGYELSSFYPNDCQNKLVFRKGDYYSYQTQQEAQQHLDYIQSHGVGKKLSIRIRQVNFS